MASPLPVLTLKPGREIHLRNRHHAIFQPAVAWFPDVADGAIVEVADSNGDFLCYATLNRNAYICARAIAFEKGDPLEILKRAMRAAVVMRTKLFAGEDTDAMRLINAEGDGIPGLIVDRYAGVLVIQLTTMGMDRLREWIVDTLMELCGPMAVFEKSTSTARKNEGLEQKEGWIRGEAKEPIAVTERGIRYAIRLTGSQKTGLFLDQREMRSLVRSMAKDRTVLDICSYVGGFSVSALKGGARSADAVDYDALALNQAKEHATMNGIDAKLLSTSAEDAFVFFRRKPMPKAYDFIVLDPPAFAKRSSDLEPAKKAYTDLNRMAFSTLPPGGLLLTCSCSYHIDPLLFQQIVFHAARQAKRSAKIIHRHRQATDHPVSIYHPEGDYLKSMLLWVG